MSTQHDYLVTVTIDGKPLGAFDRRGGGDSEADVSSRWTSAGRKVYPSRGTVADVSVGRDYERERDHELCRALEKRCGRAVMTVSEQPLDSDGNAWGKPKVWTGLLKAVNTGEVDHESEDPRDLELTMAVREVN